MKKLIDVPTGDTGLRLGSGREGRLTQAQVDRAAEARASRRDTDRPGSRGRK